MRRFFIFIHWIFMVSGWNFFQTDKQKANQDRKNAAHFIL